MIAPESMVFRSANSSKVLIVPIMKVLYERAP
jgi:hypothetical protein